MRRRDALLAIRAIDTNVSSSSFNGPEVPSGWSSVEQSGNWYSVKDPNNNRIAVNRVNTNQADTRGLFLICGPRNILDFLSSSSDLINPIVDTWQTALNSSGLARDVMRRWRWYKIDGFVRDDLGDPIAVTSHSLQLIPEGGTLPDPSVNPLPWDLDANGNLTTQSSAIVRVTKIHHPAFLRTIAGYSDDIDAVETT